MQPLPSAPPRWLLPGRRQPGAVGSRGDSIDPPSLCHATIDLRVQAALGELRNQLFF